MELACLRITQKKIEVLHAMGITSLQDLITFYPFRYEERQLTPINTWQKDQRVVLEGVIATRARVIRYKGKLSITHFKVVYEHEEFAITLFNRPWVASFVVGKVITLFGKYEGGNRITALQYNFKPVKDQLGIVPIYNLKDGMRQVDVQNYIDQAYALLKDTLSDFIPESLLQKYRLVHRREALYYIHHPTNKEALKQSLRHLKYEEFLKFQLAMQAIKAKEQAVMKGHEKHFAMEEVMQLKHTLPFALTHDQQSVIEEILYDLKSDRVMYRMVQGDVGCGKTLVAAFGMYACVLAHKQAAFMAPTEILAKQHLHNIRQLFHAFDITIEILYGSLKASEKQQVMQRLKNNEIDIVIGTHALFQEDVSFYDLGMVVADEQHRFGVSQRRSLLEKGDKVDFLLMSATPIPRTLALSLYGDMDVSTIQELPKNRNGITTRLIHSRSMAPILEEVLKKIDEGNQCYVVCPAIEKNDAYEMRNVLDIYEGMQQSIGSIYSVALLHGRMKTEEKDEVMERFLHHDIQILVSTTVIEVGVDVPNANIMVIYDAHRFGLSQLHQLRGRVGRGAKPGFCYLLSNTTDPDSIARLTICEKSSDGFAIARADLQLRGPGDILGTRQSGVPGFVLGDVVQDARILEVAREDAAHIVATIQEDMYAHIRDYLQSAVDSGTYLN